MKIKGRLTRAERNWILYDVANSSYGLIIMTTIMPLYYKGYIAGDVDTAVSTADWGFANSAAGLAVALLAPFLGAIADVKGNKKVFLGSFLGLGIVATAALSFTAPGMRLLTLIIYATSLIAFTGSCVFYDAMLVDVTSPKRMDWISGAGYAWGYVGGGIPYIFCMGLMALGGLVGLKTMAVKSSFVITALWWLAFSLPVLWGVRQKYALSRQRGTVADALCNLWTTVKKIRYYRNVALFLPAYFLYIDGVDTIIQMAVPYGRDIGLTDTLLMLTVLGLQFLAFPFALLYGRLAVVYSARRML
ncbi:MAG: MFS transporter, partial [Victivallales bacterium]|nr:MFS transporter [Victivallales bacterium]